LHQKCQIQGNQNKDRLSICELLILQQKLNWPTQNLRA